MVCELFVCCQFLNNLMKELPKTAEYIKNKICYGEYENCVRFRIYKEFGGKHIPFDLHPEDTEEVKKIIQCLRKREQAEK